MERALENTLTKSVDYLLEGCQIISFDYRYLYVNNAVAKQGKHVKEDLLGHRMMDIYPGIEKSSFFPHLRSCLEYRKVYLMDNEFTFDDGEKRWFELRIEPVPQGAIILSMDVTERKTIEKAKSDFVSIASHALRTPLGITKWYLETISGEKYLNNAPDILIRYLDEIYKNNERLLELVRNLLSVSRIDREEVKNTPQKINLIEQIKIVVRDMKIAALKYHVPITLTIKKTQIPPLFIDPSRFRETVANLITNAIKYDLDNKPVEVVMTKDDENVYISVKDQGIGIAEEDKKRIFSKFFRAETAIASNTEGSGLGLYVVKSYVEGWHGTITVISKERQGSTFTIKLPINNLQEKKN